MLSGWSDCIIYIARNAAGEVVKLSGLHQFEVLPLEAIATRELLVVLPALHKSVRCMMV